MCNFGDMELYIKNMVCPRCVIAVSTELAKLGIAVQDIGLGIVRLQQPIEDGTRAALSGNLEAMGFELLDDRKRQTVEKIKNEIVDLVHYRENDLKINLSQHLSREIGQDYSALSQLFSQLEGVTLEQYVIAQKVEKIKELLSYGELSLGEIADRLNYSSAAYLSNQFKKATGLNPSAYKRLRINRRFIDGV
jgi:AraC-like DNA-binding protein